MLRPIDPETGRTKAFKDYSVPERVSTLTQMDDDIKVKLAAGKKIERKFAEEYMQLAKGTPKEGNEHPAVVEAAKKQQ